MSFHTNLKSLSPKPPSIVMYTNILCHFLARAPLVFGPHFFCWAPLFSSLLYCHRSSHYICFSNAIITIKCFTIHKLSIMQSENKISCFSRFEPRCNFSQNRTKLVIKTYITCFFYTFDILLGENEVTGCKRHGQKIVN